MVKSLWRLMLVGTGAIALNTMIAGSAQGMNINFGVQFSNLNPSAGPDGTLRLISGDNEFSPGAYDGDFDIDEIDEYFDLEIDGFNVGRYACYDAVGITNLNGILSDEGCAFDQSFSFVEDFGLDLAALINGDGILTVSAIFSEAVELSPIGNNLTVVLGYGVVTPPANVPTPAAVLPVFGGIFSAAMRKSRKEQS